MYYEKFTDVPFTGNVTGKERGKISKGKKEGEWLNYYENGQLFIKGNFRDGKLDGEFLMYDEDGKLKRTRIYKDGEIIETITP